MRVAYLTFGLVLLTTAVMASSDRGLAAGETQSYPVQIEVVTTKYLDNVSPAGGYTQVTFTNTGRQAFSAIAFEIVPYAEGAPILQAKKDPVVFGFKGNFKAGGTYTLTSNKPVWSAYWKRVDCVHVVGLILEDAEGQTEKIGREQIKNYLRPQIAQQNCSQPSTPGPHN